MGSIDYKDMNLGRDGALGTNISIGKYSIEGFTSSFGVSNYLGIPYGQVPARFRQAQLIELSQLEVVHDGRQYGPICPQPVDEARVWRKHLYEGIQHSDSLPVSEYDCLNLNVYTPAERSIQPLPVFVWIHGGGFVVGDGGPEYGQWLLSPQFWGFFCSD
jgi:carboxylesterase type B